MFKRTEDTVINQQMTVLLFINTPQTINDKGLISIILQAKTGRKKFCRPV